MATTATAVGEAAHADVVTGHFRAAAASRVLPHITATFSQPMNR